MDLKELRKSKKLTQSEASKIIGMPLRTYVNYENDDAKAGSMKHRFIMEKIEEYGRVDEEHGILSLNDIREACLEVFDPVKVDFCYLFGSYAVNAAEERSDVDLLISTSITGLDFFGLVEELRMRLHKRIDLLPESSLAGNAELLHAVLKDGIKIYG